LGKKEKKNTNKKTISQKEKGYTFVTSGTML
jgi:hypothetical protein